MSEAGGNHDLYEARVSVWEKRFGDEKENRRERRTKDDEREMKDEKEQGSRKE